MRLFCLPALLGLVTSAGAAENLRVLPEKPPPRAMLRTYLLAEAHKAFEARRAAVAALKTPADFRKRQEALRASFLAALGDLPEKTPLKARIVGRISQPDYTVEKVVYESRPDHHVTASFYLPHGKGPFPGVLMPIGHSANGKAADSIQRGAILLARHGFAVLAYDPIGQGERRQLLQAGKPLLPSSTNEHTMAGIGALLVGRNTASYRVWDGLRSLDYLAGRPEVDPKRLGCTGCSGGGTLTSYLMALDERIEAAAPSCYITSLERLFETIGPQDAEQNITGQVAFGLEHADYLTLRAPRPTLVCCASRDFFDIQGTWTSFREAKKLYGLLGHGERVDIFESDGGHGFPRPQREVVLRWMRRWLQGKDDAPTETEAALLTEAELRCTRTGQVLEDFKGVSVFGLNARRAEELAGQRAKKQSALGKEKLLEEIARLVRVKLPVPAAKVREAGQLEREGCAVRKLLFETEPGIAVPALLFARDSDAKTPLVIYADGEGEESAAGPGGPIEKLVKEGKRVLAVDLRGFGETAPAVAKGTSLFGVDFKEAYIALHLDRPLLGQRTHDLLAVAARMMEDSAEGVHLLGVGKACPAVLHAAALDGRIKGVTLQKPLVSWSAVVRAPVSHDQLTNVVPGALALYDLPELAATLVPRPLDIHHPVDPVGKPVSAARLAEEYAATREAYTKSKAGKALVLAAAEE